MNSLTRRTVHWSYLGLVPYARAEALQGRCQQALRHGEGPEHLFLLEHPHVYTLGRNAGEDDLLADPAWLAARGVAVHHCDRGGQVTYHGPGQLVGYPILSLSPDRRDVRRYVGDLQEVLIRTLGDYGVEGHRREGKDLIGLWVGDAKIASIGVHLSRWITTHGFALNVTTDLSYFHGIVACGLPEVKMTSLEEVIGSRPAMAEIAQVYGGHFAEVFDRDLVQGQSLLPGLAVEAGVG